MLVAVAVKVIVWIARTTLKVTAMDPALYLAVVALVAVTSQEPNPVNEMTPVIESTAHPVSPAFVTT